MAKAGCRLILVGFLIFALCSQAGASRLPLLGAPSIPLIIHVGPLADILSIVNALGGSLVDSIPGSGIYLVNVPQVPLSALASLLGIDWMELNTSVSLPNFVLPTLISMPPGAPTNWYASQPAWVKLRAS